MSHKRTTIIVYGITYFIACIAINFESSIVTIVKINFIHVGMLYH